MRFRLFLQTERRGDTALKIGISFNLVGNDAKEVHNRFSNFHGSTFQLGKDFLSQIHERACKTVRIRAVLLLQGLPI